MSRIVESEARLLRKERDLSKVEVSAAMNSFAREITEGGLGTEMIEELSTGTRKDGWLRRFINKVLYVVG